MTAARKGHTTKRGRITVARGRKTPKAGRKAWEKPKVTFLGRVDEVVKRGRGKLSIPAHDPGEPLRKPRGHDR